MLEPKAPPARNGPNIGSLAPGVRRRVKKKKHRESFEFIEGFIAVHLTAIQPATQLPPNVMFSLKIFNCPCLISITPLPNPSKTSLALVKRGS